MCTLRNLKTLVCLFFIPVCAVGPFEIVSDVYAEDVEAFHLLHCDPVNVDSGVLPLLFPEVHGLLLRFIDVEGEVIFLASHSHNHCCDVCKLDD